jgi:hypothetical protein
MRRPIAIIVAFCLAFTGLLFASPALAVDGEAKDVFAARVIAKAMMCTPYCGHFLLR